MSETIANQASHAAGANQAVSPIALNEAARAELAAALARLERGRGILVRLADLLGGAVNLASRYGLRQIGLSHNVQHKFAGVAQAALARAYDVAILGLHRSPARDVALSRAAIIASGAVSGFAGFAGFLPDATFTTLTIMREIARIAADQGEDLSSEEARRACLEVFAFRSQADSDESELGYFSARLLFQGRPFTLLITEIASRYGLVLGEKLSLQAVPIVGAITGAALNAAFLDHYRNLAAAHFTIRRLERTHGRDVVRAAAHPFKNPDLDLPFSAA
jgi:hypothetical protein